jgi:hypothetical protein
MSSKIFADISITSIRVDGDIPEIMPYQLFCRNVGSKQYDRHIPFTRVSICEYKTRICLNNSLVDGAIIEVVKHGLDSCVRRLVMDIVLNRRIWINEVREICGWMCKDNMLATVNSLGSCALTTTSPSNSKGTLITAATCASVRPIWVRTSIAAQDRDFLELAKINREG